MAFAAFALMAGRAATAGDMTVFYAVHGAVEGKVSLTHVGDASHLCTVGGAPWAQVEIGGKTLEVPPGPPFYAVKFDDGKTPPQPAFRLSDFGYMPGMTAQTDSADDWIELDAGGRHWVGHRGTPKFTLALTYTPGGRSGRFNASGLHPAQADSSVRSSDSIAVDGGWQCPAAP